MEKYSLIEKLCRKLNYYTRALFKSKKVRWQLFTLISLYVLYCSLIVCRTSLDVALPSMIDDQMVLGKGFNKESVGVVLGVATGSYFIGKLVMGFFVDKIGGKPVFLFSLFSISLFTFMFGLVAGYLGMFFPSIVNTRDGLVIIIILACIWSVSRFFMSAGWSSLTRLVCAWFDESTWGTVFGILSTSSRVGNILGTLLLGGLLQSGMRWNGVFFVSAAFAAFVALLNMFLLKSNPAKIMKKGIQNQENSNMELEADQQKHPSPIASSTSRQLSSSHLKNFESTVTRKTSKSESIDLVLCKEDAEMDNENIKLSDEGDANEDILLSQSLVSDIDNNQNRGVKLNEEGMKSTTLGGIPAKSTAAPLIHVKAQKEIDTLKTWNALVYFAKSGRFWFIIISQMSVSVIFELNSFLGLYLKGVKGLTKPGEAATSASVFPIGCAISVLLVGFLYDRMSKRKVGRLIVMTILSLIALACVLIIWIWKDMSVPLTLVVIFVLGFTTSPAYYLPMSVFSVEFGGHKHCAKLSSIIDCCAYGAAMIFDFIGGSLSQKMGWDSFWLAVIVGGFIPSVIFQVLFQWAECRKQGRNL